MLKELNPALRIFLSLTVITGVLYPGMVTALAQSMFKSQANGSLIERQGRAVGSELIGQAFRSPRYFWGRPSATSPLPDNGAASSGSNLGAVNPALEVAVRARLDALHAADPANHRRVPVDLVMASGSGLDPHISPAAAEYQLERVARARGMDASRVRALVAAATQGRTFGLLGEPRVNVLELNLALDGDRK